MTTTKPNFLRPLICRENLHHPLTDNPIFNTLYRAFTYLNHLTTALRAWSPSTDVDALMSFDTQRSTLEHQLFSLSIRKPKTEMLHIDYYLEARRLGALIYLNRVLHNLKPSCPPLQSLKLELIGLIRESEEHSCGPSCTPQFFNGSLTWVWFMGGILSLNRDEEYFFAQRIVAATRDWWAEGEKTWCDMEDKLRELVWDESLRSVECAKLWARIGGILERDVGRVDGVA